MISFLTHCSCGDPSHLLFTLFWIFTPYFLKKLISAATTLFTSPSVHVHVSLCTLLKTRSSF
jgi:hypothetical protein